MTSTAWGLCAAPRALRTSPAASSEADCRWAAAGRGDRARGPRPHGAAEGRAQGAAAPPLALPLPRLGGSAHSYCSGNSLARRPEQDTLGSLKEPAYTVYMPRVSVCLPVSAFLTEKGEWQ